MLITSQNTFTAKYLHSLVSDQRIGSRSLTNLTHKINHHTLLSIYRSTLNPCSHHLTLEMITIDPPPPWAGLPLPRPSMFQFTFLRLLPLSYSNFHINFQLLHNSPFVLFMVIPTLLHMNGPFCACHTLVKLSHFLLQFSNALPGGVLSNCISFWFDSSSLLV